MERTTIVSQDGGQIICIPDAVAMPESIKRVDIVAIGRARLLTPAGDWDNWFDNNHVSADFMTDREQP
ncbi:AbrB/MazE/SpoVT family DNA-binding domain-containing protein [Pseudomonas gregormendelii]|jgi:antitoxin VapB|uniref:AbrB/MazE/SpoVT family DNA-binding domain-containing protein n=1 Tax=Pseudomonas gregormendelii TaxID=1628277 RepID=A0ABS3AJT1_9PSED|nr:AbrB/MazE/SpoVT family DNA-binding domain-containing protein [Pseudomonas gregormendelii]MBN3967429.1 AbrB/MazE/SpoVT family DNA-binding domain-containing protein [Pseudomonas gregormendelii]